MEPEIELNDDKNKENQELNIKDYIVGTLPTLIYIPNFITESEQSEVLHHIYEVPTSRWKNLKNRRLQNLGGVVHEKGLLPQDLPPWLTKITERICQQTSLFPSKINHVLINEYLPDQGIMPHQDGPAYYPVVAILSLISPVVIDFTPHPSLKESTQRETKSNEQPDELIFKEEDRIYPCSLLLMPCSLLVFKDQAYSDYLHGIQDDKLQKLDQVVNASEMIKIQEQEANASFLRTSTRVSLTCRLVLKVHRNLFKF